MAAYRSNLGTHPSVAAAVVGQAATAGTGSDAPALVAAVVRLAAVTAETMMLAS